MSTGMTAQQVTKMTAEDFIALSEVIKAEGKRRNVQPNTSKYLTSIANHVKNIHQTVQAAVKAGNWDAVKEQALASLGNLNAEVLVSEAMKVTARNTEGRGRKTKTAEVADTSELVELAA